jgi:FdhD protein
MRLNRDGSSEQVDDTVAMDAPICIFVNGEPFRTLIATPTMLEELVVGHLFAEGVISVKQEIKSLTVKPLRVDVELNHEIDIDKILLGKSRLLTTACGLDSPIPESELENLRVPRVEKVVPSLVFDIMKELNTNSLTYRETGGTHSAILYSDKGVIAFAEDVGRHSALDKVIGSAFMNDTDFSKCVLASSGRLSGEMVLKVARARIPLLCSVSAPLVSGLKIAEATGVTLVGFVRGKRMNHYILP